MRHLLAALIGLCLAPAALAATLRVPTAEFATIQRALDFAASGDTVLVGPGEYIIVTPLTVGRVEPKDVILMSESGPEVTTIRLAEVLPEDGGALLLSFETETAATVIEGFTFRSHPGPDFSGQLASFAGTAAPIFRDCVFRESAAQRNALIECGLRSRPTFERCEFSDNVANRGVVLATSLSAPRFRECRFLRNGTTGLESGAVVSFASGQPSFESCHFEGNRARSGAAIRFGGPASSITIEGCTFFRNRARSDGGAVLVSNSQRVLIRDCLFADNHAARGGGLRVAGPQAVSIVDSTFLGNVGSSGVAIDLATTGPAVLENCLVAANDSRGDDDGGAIRTTSATTVRRSTIAHTLGAAFSVKRGALEVDRCIVWANRRALHVDDGVAGATRSCLQPESGLEGEGNSSSDPLFCGPTAATIDPARGTDLLSAFSWSLASTSPCRGLGASLGTPCESPSSSGDVRIGRGDHELPDFLSRIGMRLVGAGRDETTLRGVLELANGTGLASLTIVGSLDLPRDSASLVEDCTIRDGHGVLVRQLASVTFRDCTIAGHTRNPAVFVLPEAHAALESCELRDNTTGFGGGISCNQGTAIVESCLITNNSVGSDGGGIYLNECEASIVDSRIEHNEASEGGGISVEWDSRLSLLRSTVSRNRARAAGGGIAVSVRSSAEIRSCVLEANIAQRGGALSLGTDSELTVTRTELVGNGAWRGGAYAGFPESTATLESCVIAGNFAGDAGGGISARRCTLTLDGCTVSGNHAGQTGGAALDVSSAITATNSILWGNSPDEVFGFVDLRYSTARIPGVRGQNVLEEDPQFIDPGEFDFAGFTLDSELADFIARRPDFRLRPGSPSIDAGDPQTPPGADILGNPRPCGGRVDMGAYESDCGTPPIEFIRGDADASSTVTVADGVFVLEYLLRGGAAPPCADAADADDSGRVNITDGIVVLSYLFAGGPAPPAPGPLSCGPDADDGDGLSCERFDRCGREPDRR